MKAAKAHRFINQAAQGDLLITRIASIPPTAIPATAAEGKYILAHSETGHHHTVAERPGVEFFSSADPLVSYLRVIESVESMLEHEREFDTHDTLLVSGGSYEIRRQREYTPEGLRRVED